MAVYVGSARGDERGKASGGVAGDQATEVSTQKWYKHSKGWRVFRAKDPAKAKKIAKAMLMACDNKKVGYDQMQRSTLYVQAKKVDFDISKVTVACETDCSALVRVCCAYAGIMLADFNTSSQPNILLKSGAFEELKGAKYTDSSTLLKTGDILVTKTKGHTVVVTSDDNKESVIDIPEKEERKTVKITFEVLQKGDEGIQVKNMQLMLKAKGYSLPKYGADGDYGNETVSTVKKFQRDQKIAVDGIAGAKTLTALYTK